MAAPEEVARTHTHTLTEKNTAAKQPQCLTFSLVCYSCGVSKGWMGTAASGYLQRSCSPVRPCGAQAGAEQLFCSGLFVPA